MCPQRKGTEMTEHTPTPWTIEEVKTSCGRCFKIGSPEMLNGEGKPTYVCVYDDYGRGDNQQQANAAFIVEAVNGREALLTEIDRLQEAKRRALAVADERAKEANEMRQALESLVKAEALASVRGIVAGWNGDGREGVPFKRHPDNLGATIPKTRCKAIYDLDEAIERAKALLASAAPLK
jgi:hypothetical protein